MNEEAAIERMAEGKGGTLLIDIGFNDTLIVRDGKYYTCAKLEVEQSVATCTTGYDKFTKRNFRDYCFALRYSLLIKQTVRQYCLPSDDKPTGFNVNLKADTVSSNLNVECVSYTQGTPNLLINDDEFYKLCGRTPMDPITFKFYANHRSDVPMITNPKGVVCDHYVCEFKSPMVLDRTYNVSNKNRSAQKNSGNVTLTRAVIP